VHDGEDDDSGGADAAGHEDDGIEDDLRHRVEGDDDGLDDLAHQAIETEHHAEQQPDDHLDDQREEEGVEGRIDVRPEIGRAQQPIGVGDSGERRRQGDRADEFVEQLPDEQEDEQEDDGVAEPPAENPSGDLRAYHCPRLCRSARSHAKSNPFTAEMTSTTSRMSEYILTLSKSLKAKAI